MNIREYRGPLTVLASGVLGFSLICIVSAAAISGPNLSNRSIDLEPQDLVDSAISNMNTLAALTMESVAEYIPTATLSPTITSTQTELPTPTATLFPTRTRIRPTNTRYRPGFIPSATSTRAPTATHTPIPDTNTPIPDTDTPIPDTNTPIPDTSTPIPDTNTPIPDTPIPDTAVPDTNTPGSTEPPPTTGASGDGNATPTP